MASSASQDDESDRSRSVGEAAPALDELSTDAEEYAAECEADFREDTRRISRNLIFMHLEATMHRQGKDRKQISGVCGQLMRFHAQLSVPLLRARLASRLPAIARETLDRQLAFLRDRWDTIFQPNDSSFIDAMGSRDDPAPARLRHYFSTLLQVEVMAAGLTSDEGQQLQHAVNRYTRGFEYRRLASFCMRSLGADSRRQFLVWVADVRMHNRNPTRAA